MRVLNDEEIKKIDIPLNLSRYWMSARRYAGDVAKAQFKQDIKDLIELLIDEKRALTQSMDTHLKDNPHEEQAKKEYAIKLNTLDGVIGSLKQASG